MAVAMLALLVVRAGGQTHEGMIVDTATAVLQEIASVPAQGIPRSLLNHARGVAVIPGAIKLGFVAGFRGGRGVITMRDEQGGWRPPMFVTLTGGSVGWQAGIQSTDIVLVFKTQDSVDRILRGKLTLGADASIAAGPIGRQAEAATDAALSSEIYSYSRSRGIFAGVSLGGSVIQSDLISNQAFYQRENVMIAPGQATPLPASAIRFLAVVSSLTGGNEVPAVGPAVASAAVASSENEAVRASLIQSSRQLQSLLDPQWQAYLSLPPSVLSPEMQVPAAALQETLSRFDTVAANAQYATLARRPEFETTRQLLRRYVEVSSAPTMSPLTLPPPPAK
jgi:lipid-binding SYLF domain-containing protein